MKKKWEKGNGWADGRSVGRADACWAEERPAAYWLFGLRTKENGPRRRKAY
jgi:hypothetical protein